MSTSVPFCPSCWVKRLRLQATTWGARIRDDARSSSPWFSFIIPALNEEECSAACIQSILDQSEPAFQTIVMDNGSTDRTAEIARRLRCAVIYESKPALSHARNEGVVVAAGDAVCSIDADGVLARNWLTAAPMLFRKPQHWRRIGTESLCPS